MGHTSRTRSLRCRSNKQDSPLCIDFRRGRRIRTWSRCRRTSKKGTLTCTSGIGNHKLELNSMMQPHCYCLDLEDSIRRCMRIGICRLPKTSFQRSSCRTCICCRKCTPCKVQNTTSIGPWTCPCLSYWSWDLRTKIYTRVDRGTFEKDKSPDMIYSGRNSNSQRRIPNTEIHWYISHKATCIWCTLCHSMDLRNISCYIGWCSVRLRNNSLEDMFCNRIGSSIDRRATNISSTSLNSRMGNTLLDTIRSNRRPKEIYF